MDREIPAKKFLNSQRAFHSQILKFCWHENALNSAYLTLIFILASSS